MSKHPPTVKLPKPAGHSAAAEYLSFEHDALLRLAWGALDCLAQRLALTRREFEEQVAACTKTWNAEKKAALKRARVLLDAADWGEMGQGVFWENQPEQIHPALREAAQSSFDALKTLELPSTPDCDLTPVISERHLAKAITHDPRTGASVKTVGYIDIELAVEAVREINLTAGIPTAFLAEDVLSDRTITASHFALSEPEWDINKVHQRVWVDIRPVLPPVGELLRQLKTLDEFGDDDTTIVVLTEQAVAEVASMLAHEGHLLLARNDLKPVRAAGSSVGRAWRAAARGEGQAN